MTKQGKKIYVPTGTARERVLKYLKMHPEGISIQVLDRGVDVGSFKDGEWLPDVVNELIAEGLVATEYDDDNTQPSYRLVKSDDQR